MRKSQIVWILLLFLVVIGFYYCTGPPSIVETCSFATIGERDNLVLNDVTCAKYDRFEFNMWAEPHKEYARGLVIESHGTVVHVWQNKTLLVNGPLLPTLDWVPGTDKYLRSWNQGKLTVLKFDTVNEQIVPLRTFYSVYADLSFNGTIYVLTSKELYSYVPKTNSELLLANFTSLPRDSRFKYMYRPSLILTNTSLVVSFYTTNPRGESNMSYSHYVFDVYSRDLTLLTNYSLSNSIDYPGEIISQERRRYESQETQHSSKYYGLSYNR